MKLLLTSGGITNKKIAEALLDLVGKPASEINLAFISTAANVDTTSKEWFINDLNNIKQQKYKFIDIVDISALPKWNWQPRLEAANILFFCGGVTPHLMRWIEESGLKELLPELLKTRVFVGISAGSIVASPTLALSSKAKQVYYKEKFGYESGQGLNLVDFYFRPHLNTPGYPHTSKEALAEIAKQIPQTIYGIDDQMALKVFDGKVEIVGEGEYLVFNQ
jgi:dipeptidase E